MTVHFVQFVLTGLSGSLTPQERFQAMRQLDSGIQWSGLMTNKWFVLLGWSLIVFLLMLLMVVHRMRVEKERRQMAQRYDALSEESGLTAAEREILDAIAVRVNLHHKDIVFTQPEAFEDGLARLMQDVFSDGQNLVYRRKLQAAVYSIKEKLGYVKPACSGQPHSGSVQSSRHIPVGKTVRLSPAGQEDVKHIQAEVIVNDPYELVVAPEFPLASRCGQLWTVQYDTGSVTWEFEAITLAGTERGLELNHSDRIRFVNRRRFPRVAVRKDAFIAPFPLFRGGTDVGELRPVFYDARVNEISGPGLRIHTDLKLTIGERVLVGFEVEPGRIVQDIGLVRDFRQTPLDQALIVELVGLNDRVADELVRITNQLVGQAHAAAQEQRDDSVLAGVT